MSIFAEPYLIIKESEKMPIYSIHNDIHEFINVKYVNVS